MFGNVYQNTKVLITGYTGFKGSWLCQWLYQLGANLSGYSLALDGSDHFSKLNIDGHFELGDINDLEHFKDFISKQKPEIVFHLAAQALVRESYHNPIETFQTNAIGTANILEACRHVPEIKAVVIITTDKCYENHEWIWGYRENEALGGHDPYSASKACTELIVSSYRRSFFSLDKYGDKHNTLIASARAGNVIGGGDWAKDRLIPDLIRTVNHTSPIEIRCPNATRPWQHVLDCLSAYLTLGQHLFQGQTEFADAWNFGPSNFNNISVGEIVTLAAKHWQEISYKLGDNKLDLHEANALSLDCSKAHKYLKWKNVWDLNICLEKTINWYKQFINTGELMTNNDIESFIDDAKNKELAWALN